MRVIGEWEKGPRMNANLIGAIYGPFSKSQNFFNRKEKAEEVLMRYSPFTYFTFSTSSTLR
jgi:hypothetical protein